MKQSLLSVLVLTLLSASALADTSAPVGFEMEPIVSCKAIQSGLRFGERLLVRHARIGTYQNASFNEFFMGRSTQINATSVVQSNSGSDEIFTARTQQGEFRLTLDMARADEQGWAPAIFELGAQKYDMTCEHLMMAL